MEGSADRTIAETPRGRASAAGPAPPMTPDAAVDLDESRRAKVFVLFIFPLCFLTGTAMFIIGGDPTYRLIHLGGLAVVLVAAVWFFVVARDPATYRPWHQTVFGHCAVIAVASGFLYWGPHSAVLLVVPFGAFIFSTGKSLLGALQVTLHVMIQHAVIFVLLAADVLPDHALVGPRGMSTPAQIVVLIVIQFVFVATFVIARRTRRSTYDAVVELERAVRTARQREAQLAEVEEELRAVRQAGGRGAYTDREIAGYRLGVLLGRGAMGEVYEAVAKTGETCAVKMLHPHLADQPQPLRRFLREAEIAASVDCPNIVRVYEVTSDAGGELPLIAMERLVGEDLAAMLKREPTLPVARIAELARQVGAGLAAAHDAGIVHRDLKPGNLFAADVGGVRVWKVLDFGVSKLAAGSGTLTHGHVIGTPAYMAPEQARGGEVDGRADLYALGVIAYRAITGSPAVAAGDVPAMLYDVCYRMPERPSSLVEIPRAIDHVLAIALAKDPDARFASGAALADALVAAATGRLSSALEARARALEDRAPWGREIERGRHGHAEPPRG
ncbi:MAG TPA: serine/threonine-protein kinase [Kofleriaceae bacterium]|nr:serine/threonine-protein kinase [Kofleriaceae bacterium]